jgi:hypothetical protein
VGSTAGLVNWWRLGDSGTTAADSKGTNTGTYVNGPVQVASLLGSDTANLAHDFDGVNDYVDMAPAGFGTPAQLSVEAWVRIDAKKSGQGAHWLVTDSLNDGVSDGFALSVDNSNRPRLFVGRSSTVRATATSSQALAVGTVYHVVGTYDGSTVRVYVNGVERASAAYTGGVAYVAGRDLRLGRQFATTNVSARYLNGRLDEVALYNQALSAATVLSHYNSGK